MKGQSIINGILSMFVLTVFLIAGTAVAGSAWDGKWKTSYGSGIVADLTIDMANASKCGTYSYQGGSLTNCEASASKLTGTWTETKVGNTGTFEFYLNSTGNKFTGSYKYKGETATYPWNGERAKK